MSSTYIDANRAPNESDITTQSVPPKSTFSDSGNMGFKYSSTASAAAVDESLDTSTSSITKWLTSPLGLIVLAAIVYFFAFKKK